MSFSPGTTQKETLLSPRQVEGLIADGRTIIIVDDKVLKVDAWLKYHPGGDKAIMHMVGRDATDELNAFHSAEARKQMERYQIGTIQPPWENYVPPIQGGKFRPYFEDIEASIEDSLEDNSEMESTNTEKSRSPSPLFDSERLTVRRRGAAGKAGLARSSSVSSISLSTDGREQDWDNGLSYIADQTKEKLNLDLTKYPSLDADTQNEIIAKYRLLDNRLHAEGLYNCNYSAYAKELPRYIFLFGMMILCLRWGWYTTSGLFLGVFWHQLVFTIHDAGHMGITHNFTVDTVIGMIMANFFGGLSLGWWKHNHNVHHLVTNAPEHDPDIEHLPFFAISHKFFTSLRSSYFERIMPYGDFSKFILPYQAYLYYPLLTFGRFNLYALSWGHLIRGTGPKKGAAAWHRHFEIVGEIVFWIWFGYGIVYRTIPTYPYRLAFVLASHMVTMPLHVQFTLSHWAMSTADLGPNESFPQKMLRTTMDVDCPPWLDFFHGGLQFQAIHHLYPRVPRHNLRRVQKLVMGFCEDVGIPYALYGFVDGNKEVLGRLEEVGRQAAVLAECQKAILRKGEFLREF
ncbi:MAG: hypothetical protein M1834_003798 [Cirrosporium novae-zelandiae]|nr:MAG: hypothetical protein M1834_003798 [Cirrosporium novae-zelandiae]